MAVQTTNIAGTGETTIITAGQPGVNNVLTELIITTTNAAAATLTLKDGMGGTIRAIFDYPNAAVAPNGPLRALFDPALRQSAPANNWTLTASANASHFSVTAIYSEA